MKILLCRLPLTSNVKLKLSYVWNWSFGTPYIVLDIPQEMLTYWHSIKETVPGTLLC